MENKGYLFAVSSLALIIIAFAYLNVEQAKQSARVTVDDIGECKTIQYDGEDHIDMVFISTVQDAEAYMNILGTTEPYKSYSNYFNAYVIDDVSPTCELYKDIAILCNTLEIQRVARRCPNDYIVVVKDSPANIRSSAFGNVMSINKNHQPSVFIHEFGHAFGNFAEEYGGAKIPKGSKNCVASCEKFSGPVDACTQECSQSNFYRSIPAGVMRTLTTTNYGLYNNELLKKIIEKNAPSSESITGRAVDVYEGCVEKTLVPIEITKTAEGIITAQSTNEERVGCAPNNAGEGPLCIVSNERSLCYPAALFTDAQDEGEETLHGETFDIETVIINVEKDQGSVAITYEGTLITTIDLAQAGATACIA